MNPKRIAARFRVLYEKAQALDAEIIKLKLELDKLDTPDMEYPNEYSAASELLSECDPILEELMGKLYLEE